MARFSLVSCSGSSASPTRRRSRAAFRPSPVILSMLSTLGSIFSFFRSSARFTSVWMYCLRVSLAGEASTMGRPVSSSGRGSCSMPAVWISATVRNMVRSSGILMKRAKRVFMR
jgi:hypothetical protein